ncbi:MAG: hypothetical protein WCH99_07480 [Verrucomicrobiota bacterium]
MSTNKPKQITGLRPDELPGGAEIIEVKKPQIAEVQGRCQIEFVSCPYCGCENEVLSGFGTCGSKFLQVHCKQCGRTFHYQ